MSAHKFPYRWRLADLSLPPVDAPDAMLPFLTGMCVAPVQMAHIATAIKDQWLCKN